VSGYENPNFFFLLFGNVIYLAALSMHLPVGVSTKSPVCS
jgi:hypothetical protein